MYESLWRIYEYMWRIHDICEEFTNICEECTNICQEYKNICTEIFINSLKTQKNSEVLICLTLPVPRTALFCLKFQFSPACPSDKEQHEDVPEYEALAEWHWQRKTKYS